MIAPTCSHEHVKKFGKDRKGQQRMRCLDCGKTWTVTGPRPIGGIRLPLATAEICLRMLLEGSSIRSVSRITGVHHATIIDLVVLIGRRCHEYLLYHKPVVQPSEVQIDEVWGFVHCKEKWREKRGYGDEAGDCYTFIATDRHTKLVIAFHAGKRTPEDTRWFTDNLADATDPDHRFHLSSDGYKPYNDAVFESFRNGVDFGQIIKIFGKPRSANDNTAEMRYSPGTITKITKRKRIGEPVWEKISTSIAERNNLSVRMGCRRMTRLTNAHSKKWENHEAALALWFMWYNYGRVHMTLQTTPAVQAGLTDHIWTLREMLGQLAECG